MLFAFSTFLRIMRIRDRAMALVLAERKHRQFVPLRHRQAKAHPPRPWIVGEIKFTDQVLPDAKVVSYEIDIRRVLRGRLKLVIADGRTYVDGREIYTAADMRVGLFQSTEAK